MDTIRDEDDVTEVAVDVHEMVLVPGDRDVLVADGKLRLVGTLDEDDDACSNWAKDKDKRRKKSNK